MNCNMLGQNGSKTSANEGLKRNKKGSSASFLAKPFLLVRKLNIVLTSIFWCGTRSVLCQKPEM